MKPVLQSGSVSVSTRHDAWKAGVSLRRRRNRLARCSSVEQLESRCLLSTVTEVRSLASGLPANAEPQGITSGVDATGKPVLWFTDTITNPSLGSLGRIDPADPTHIPAEIPVPAGNIGFYKYNSSKIVSDPATGNLWFSEVH